MELKENLKNGCTCKTKKYGVVKVVNDEKKFKTYLKMGLDVFKNDEDRKQEVTEAKALKATEKLEEERLKDREKYQNDKMKRVRQIAKDLKNAEKINKEAKK